MIPLLLQKAVAQSLSGVWLFVTPWTAAHQAPMSFTISWSLLKFMPIDLLMLFNPLILCHPLLLLPSIFPSIRVFSKEFAVCIRWSKYWKGKSWPNGRNSRVVQRVAFKYLMRAIQGLCMRKVPGKEPFERIRVKMTRNNACAHQLDWKGLASVGRIILRLDGTLDLPNTLELAS